MKKSEEEEEEKEAKKEERKGKKRLQLCFASERAFDCSVFLFGPLAFFLREKSFENHDVDRGSTGEDAVRQRWRWRARSGAPQTEFQYR